MIKIKTKEEKEQEKRDKLNARVNELIAQYNADHLTDPATAEDVSSIIERLVVSGLRDKIHIDVTDNDDNRDLLKRIDIYTRGIFAQNFILINQLDELISLEKNRQEQ